MPIQVPLLNGGNIPLRQTGIQTQRTARLESGDRGALGGAVQDIGQALGQMAERERELADTRELIAFEGKMRQAMDEQSRFQLENQNQDDWLPAWEHRRTALQQALDKTPLSERARLNLTQSFGEFSDRHTLAIRGQAFDQARKRTRLDVENRITQAVESGDVGAVGQVLNLAGSAFLPEERDRLQMEAEQRAKTKAADIARTRADTFVMEGNIDAAVAEIERAPIDDADKANTVTRLKTQAGRRKEREDLLVIAATDPDKAAELAVQKEKDGAISGADRVDIIREAEQVKAFNRRDAVTTYKERIAMGDIPDFEALKQDNRLTDFDRFSLVEIASGNTNDPAEFERALVSAMAFDPSQYADDKSRVTAAANLEAMFETRFQGAYLQTLKDELGKRTNPDTVPSAETDIGPAMKWVGEAIERGGLDNVVGPIRVPERDASGNIILEKVKDQTILGRFERNVFGKAWTGEEFYTGEKKIKGGEMVPKMTEDPLAKEKAAAIQREIRELIESEIKSGKLKSQLDIQDRAAGLFKSKGGAFIPKPAGVPAPGASGLPVGGGVQIQASPLLPPLTAEQIRAMNR